MSEKVISLKVITPTRILFEGEARSFIVKTRGEVGEFAVLADHAPMTASVGIGKLVIVLPNGEEKISTLFDGYVVVQNNNAVIISEAAEWPDEIDEERALRSKERAEKRIAEKENIDMARAQSSLLRALVRLDLHKVRK